MDMFFSAARGFQSSVKGSSNSASGSSISMAGLLVAEQGDLRPKFTIHLSSPAAPPDLRISGSD